MKQAKIDSPDVFALLHTFCANEEIFENIKDLVCSSITAHKKQLHKQQYLLLQLQLVQLATITTNNCNRVSPMKYCHTSLQQSAMKNYRLFF